MNYSLSLCIPSEALSYSVPASDEQACVDQLEAVMAAYAVPTGSMVMLCVTEQRELEDPLPEVTFSRSFSTLTDAPAMLADIWVEINSN